MRITDTILKDRLVFISLFIAVYENFKDYLEDAPEQLFKDKIVNNAEGDKKRERCGLYKDRVSSLKVLPNGEKATSSQKAMLYFHKEYKIFTEEEIYAFGEISEERNRLTHEMSSLMIHPVENEYKKMFYKIIEWYQRLTNFWCCSFEMAIDVDGIPPNVDDSKVVTVEFNNLLKVIDLLMHTNFAYNGPAILWQGLYKNLLLPLKETI